MKALFLKEIWPSSSRKFAAAIENKLSTIMKDVTRFRGVVVVFSQLLHKSLGNINAITFVKPSDLTNREILTPILGHGKEIGLQIYSYHWCIAIDRCTSMYLHTTTLQMQSSRYRRYSWPWKSLNDKSLTTAACKKVNDVFHYNSCSVNTKTTLLES